MLPVLSVPYEDHTGTEFTKRKVTAVCYVCDMWNCFLWGKYYSVYSGTGREVRGNCTEPYGFWRVRYYS